MKDTKLSTIIVVVIGGLIFTFTCFAAISVVSTSSSLFYTQARQKMKREHGQVTVRIFTHASPKYLYRTASN